MSKIKDFISTAKGKIFVSCMAVMCVLASALPLTASAAEDTTTFPVTGAMLKDVSTHFTSAIDVAVPVGVGIMAVLLGVKFVPKIIKYFIK